MTNGIGAETPKNKISTAKGHLEFALRLAAAINEDKITPEIFNQGVKVFTNEEGTQGIRLPPAEDLTKEELQNIVHNIVHAALGFSAICLDEVLDEVFGRKNPTVTTGVDALRAMVYQLRNSFAHNPYRPKWQIAEHYRRIYEIRLSENNNIDFNAITINGKPIKPEDVGGFKFWIKVLDECEQLVTK